VLPVRDADRPQGTHSDDNYLEEWPAMLASAVGPSSLVFGDGRGGQRAGAMTSGILVGLMATGAILLAAIVGAIWLEGRMPGQPEQRLRPSSPGHQPRPVTVPAGRQWAILARPAWAGFRTHGRHHR
jgi:hypothetical protein